MSTSEPHPDPIRILSKELAALNRRVAKLLSRFNAYVPPQSDLTILQFCGKHQISRAWYYKMRARGKGPDTLVMDGVIRITPEADDRWSAARRAEASQTIEQEHQSGEAEAVGSR